jgi:hypothetical protein
MPEGGLMKKHIVLLILLSFLGLNSGLGLFAEPTPSVRWIMNENASIFDLGMFRLELRNINDWIPKFLKEAEKLGVTLSPNMGRGVYYDWDENTILIEVTVIGTPTEELAEELVVMYKDVILSPMRRPGSEFDIGLMIMKNFFDHYDHTSKSRPDDLDKNLMNIFRFQVGIHESENITSKSIYATCNYKSDFPKYEKF